MTLEEYAELHKLTKPAVLYRIKKKKIKAKKDRYGKWNIQEEKDTEEIKEEISYKHKLELAEQHIKHLEEKIQDKELIIDAERRSNIALLTTVEQYKAIEHSKENKSPLNRFLSRFFTTK